MIVRLLLLILSVVSTVCLNMHPPSLLLGASNPLVSNWSEEADIRERQSQYAKEKFSQHYHFFQNFTDNETKKIPKRQEIIRKKREAIMGSIATAVVTGMIGMTAKAVSDLTSFHLYPLVVAVNGSVPLHFVIILVPQITTTFVLITAGVPVFGSHFFANLILALVSLVAPFWDPTLQKDFAASLTPMIARGQEDGWGQTQLTTPTVDMTTA